MNQYLDINISFTNNTNVNDISSTTLILKNSFKHKKCILKYFEPEQIVKLENTVQQKFNAMQSSDNFMCGMYDCCLESSKPEFSTHNSLVKFIDFCNYHAIHETEIINKPLVPNWLEVLCEFDRNLIDIDKDVLLNLLTFTNKVKYEKLLNFCGAAVAYQLSGKTKQQMRDYLGIVNDLTQEEEAQIEEENRWLEY